MKSHGNTAQVKEQSRNRQIQVNEDDIGKLPEKEFRIMIIKMIQNFKTRMEKMQESINKVLEDIKNKQTEKRQLLKLKIFQKESIAESEAEDWISELEARMVETTSEEQNKRK